MVNEATYQNITNPYYNPQDRAQMLLQDLLRQVTSKPGLFYIICDIFEKEIVPEVDILRGKCMFLSRKGLYSYSLE